MRHENRLDARILCSDHFHVTVFVADEHGDEHDCRAKKSDGFDVAERRRFCCLMT